MPTRQPSDDSVPAQYASLDPGLINLFTRNSERLASVETGLQKLNGDTDVMRHALHEVNGKMQLFVIAEQNCGAALKSIDATMKEHTEEIKKLAAAREQMTGVWWAIARICTMILIGFGIVGTIIGAAAWVIEHNVQITASPLPPKAHDAPK